MIHLLIGHYQLDTNQLKILPTNVPANRLGIPSSRHQRLRLILAVSYALGLLALFRCADGDVFSANIPSASTMETGSDLVVQSAIVRLMRIVDKMRSVPSSWRSSTIDFGGMMMTLVAAYLHRCGVDRIVRMRCMVAPLWWVV